VQLAVTGAVAQADLPAALVAVAAQELGHLGRQRGLHDQSHAQARDLRQDLAEVLVGGEQRIDLGATGAGTDQDLPR
jgi:hypothetical protein